MPVGLEGQDVVIRGSFGRGTYCGKPFAGGSSARCPGGFAPGISGTLFGAVGGFNPCDSKNMSSLFWPYSIFNSSLALSRFLNKSGRVFSNVLQADWKERPRSLRNLFTASWISLCAALTAASFVSLSFMLPPISCEQ